MPSITASRRPRTGSRAASRPSGCLRLRAFHEGGQVNIEISDDGSGIDIERVDPQRPRARARDHADQAARMGDHDLLQPDLPARDSVPPSRITSVSGRGVGMDVVKTNIEKIGGTVDIQSTPGHGTTLKIKIPLTLAIIPALIVSAGGDRFAIPQVSLLELVRLERDQAKRRIETIHGAPIFRLRGSLLPVVSLERLLSATGQDTSAMGWRDRGEARNVDLNRLREMHLRWKARLTRFLAGEESLDPDKLASPEECELGHWLKSDGIRELEGRNEFANLIRVHKSSTPRSRTSSSCTAPASSPRQTPRWLVWRASRSRSWPG